MKIIQLQNAAFKKAIKKAEPIFGADIAGRAESITVLHNDYLCHFSPIAEGRYKATCPRFRSLVATGTTLAQAKANLADEITTLIDALDDEAEQIRMSSLASLRSGQVCNEEHRDDRC